MEITESLGFKNLLLKVVTAAKRLKNDVLSQTDGVVESGEVLVVVLLQPVVEVLGVIRGISFPVRGHAKDGQGVFNLGQTRQLRLERHTDGGESETSLGPDARPHV